MPIQTPFHPRTQALCKSYKWKIWAGAYAVCSYETVHDPEYYAFRQSAGVIDVTPLYKYDVTGTDATSFLSRVMTRDISKLKNGQVTYCCWCDDAGKIIDDGTVTRFAEDRYRVTAAEPSYAWFVRYQHGYEVNIEDVSRSIGTLALQGPNSKLILSRMCGDSIQQLGFFKAGEFQFDGFSAVVSRTGYTGDLGYEIWVPEKNALKLWDQLMDAGRDFALMPCGLDALDMTRIEAGFIMNAVDYQSANHCMIQERKSTPYELGLGWTVNLEREPFNGQSALQDEFAKGPQKIFTGIMIDWEELESLFAIRGLPPEICTQAWRQSIPVYNESMTQIGYATSGTWSPVLKKNLALVTLQPKYGKPGTSVRFELTVEHERQTVAATVTPPPFFNPERKKA